MRRRKHFPELEARERAIRNARQHDCAPRFCQNCGEALIGDGHFVPPSFGDAGFFPCCSLQPQIRRDTLRTSMGSP